MKPMSTKSDRIGRIAYIRYKGGVKGEAAFDDRSVGEPLAVLLGEGRVPKGIEKVLYEMQPGEQRVFEIPPQLGYGEYRPERAAWYPRTVLPRGYELKKGSVLSWTNPETRGTIPAQVVDETTDTVRVDLNHPWAGKTLVYWLELVNLT
jgi:FKBP-type peptidyl-prolyl cis-trans isomerase 2